MPVRRRDRLLLGSALALVLAAGVLGGCGGSGASADPPGHDGSLLWGVPRLHEPEVKAVGSGYTELHLDPNRDYIVELPKDEPKVGALTLVGGHDIVIIGGEIVVPTGTPPGTQNNRYRSAIYIDGATGTVQIEGVLLKGEPGVAWDGVDIAAPQATVQLENVRAERVRGSFNGFHGDVVQPWGGVRRLRIDRLSASSTYQGLTIDQDLGAIGSAEIDEVDLHQIARTPAQAGKLIWLTSGTSSCDTYPIQLRSVYMEPIRGVQPRYAVWPQWRTPRPCGARVRGSFVFWPALTSVTGSIRVGTPPGGPFVPKGTAGASYAE
ncbi:MAG TPA: hypothetical protein VGG40_08090 [Solirubrobacterales bacterium]|jgi:hypothetical protein